MKARLVVLLALIVISPLAIAGWLGARIVRDERTLVEHRMQRLVLGQLRAVADDIAEILERYGEGVAAEMDSQAARPGARPGNSLRVRQYYRLDSDGRITYPSLKDPASWSASEREALTRTRQIWESGALMAAAEAIAHRGGAGEETTRSSQGIGHGWYAWYWGDGLQLMRWERKPDGIVHVAELERVRLLSELVGALPDTDPSEAGLGGRLRLVDSNGRTVYQWGEYEPPDDSQPFETLPLDHPLAAWSLEFHAPEGALGTAVAGGLVLNLVAGIVTLGVVVIGSGAYFYREHTRQMREAAQRVSFVNQVSHELKTPLTNIRLYAEMLQGEIPTDDATLQHHAEVVVSESQRLSRLIGNILTFSRQQRRVLKVNRESGVVDEVLAACLDRFRPALDVKGIAVEFRPGAPQRASFDHDMLEQIVGNLIGNVEKYAAEGKRLRLASERRGNEVRVLVADGGKGIPLRERERIFQPFYRIDDKLTEGVSGTGIGLSIARELARLHGGDLKLIDASKGACFQLTIDAAAIEENGS